MGVRKRFVTVTAVIAALSATVAGCGAPQQPEDPRPPTPIAALSSGTWLEVTGAWSDRVTLPPDASPECIRYSGPHVGAERNFTARTSDFAHWDAGGENPGRDFDVQVHVPDVSSRPDDPPSVTITFSDWQGRHFRIGANDGQGAAITASDHDPTVRFEVTGNATSIDAGPVLIRAAGQIHCESFVDQQ